MIKYGAVNRLKVIKTVDFGVYLTFDGEENILLPRNSTPVGTVVGSEVEVFVYFDSEDRPVASTRFPRVRLGEFALLKCVENNALGAFMDWGLEKDLFVPFKHQQEHMRTGRSYVVTVLYDEVSKRLIGSSRFDKVLHGDPAQAPLEKPLKSIVFGETAIGYQCVVEGNYLGLLYKSECPEALQIGDRPVVYAAKLRPDGKLDLRNRAAGMTGVLAEQQHVLDAIREAGGFIPYTPQTAPEEIRRRFKLSKRLFKSVLGTLYKRRLIEIADDGVRLTAAEPE